MKRISTRLVVAIFIIALIASSCRGDATAPANEGNNANTSAPTAASGAVVSEEKPAPLTSADLTVTATLEDRPAATATIGPEGGTLSTVDANGTQYTLVIPEGALLYYVDISMTPLDGVEGEVMDDTFLAGVRLEPDGLQFIELVSLEITGAVIEEGAIGFTAQSDGQTLHLVPSTSEQGSLTLTTTHFSDPGAAKNELAENLEGLEGLADSISDLENTLAKMKDSNEAIAFLKYKAEELQRQGATVIGLENWHAWTYDISDLLSRLNEAYYEHQWDQNSPRGKDLRTQMSLLVDEWYIATDNTVPVISKKCEQGEIIYMTLNDLIAGAAHVFEQFFPSKDDFREGKLKDWKKALSSCYNWAVDWQANVGTKGTVQTFENFINLGAESQIGVTGSNYNLTSSTELKVLYVQGFFQGLCEPTVGTATLIFNYQHSGGKLIINNNEIDPTGHKFDIRLGVKVDEYPSIDCGQGLLKPGGAEANMPFHGEALMQLNKGRLVADGSTWDGFWVYDLVYKPGGGVIAQFQEGYFEAGEGSKPKIVTWDGAKAELSQLVNLYVSPPGD